MNYNYLCINCMREKHSQEERCPWCGFDPAVYQQDLDVLQPYSVLNGKYILGKVLGRGGFGITYLGYDAILDRVVAIKEFFPTGMITRGTGMNTVSVCGDRDSGAFQAGLNSFIEEGQKLSRFSHVRAIVDVYDCFLENGTGYIVMDYLEGRTLQQFLKERGKLPYQEAKRILLEVLEGLRSVHQVSLIHRDISPDNIFILNDGSVRLLDFGAARYATMDRSRAMSVILKPGYAPIEQYNSRSQQGPWTDIYAAGATFYRMITGERPLESTVRVMKDDLRLPSTYGIPISREQENVLMKSLEIFDSNRIRTADEYIRLLERVDLSESPEQIKPETEHAQPSRPESGDLHDSPCGYADRDRYDGSSRHAGRDRYDGSSRHAGRDRYDGSSRHESRNRQDDFSGYEGRNPYEMAHGHRGRKVVIAAGILAAVLLAAGAGAYGYKMISDRNHKESKDNTTSELSENSTESVTESEMADSAAAETAKSDSAETEETEETGSAAVTATGETETPDTEVAATEIQETEAQAPAVTMSGIASLYASSELNEVEYGIYHTVGSICDSDLSTAWVEAVNGNGSGESVMFVFDREYRISGIRIWAGFQQNEDLYFKNSRPAGITLRFSDGKEFSCTLEDINDSQEVSFDPVTTDSVQLVINSAYSGWKYEDTCISELEFY